MDKKYWDEFYSRLHPDIQAPSTFAKTCLPHLRAGQSLFELGCGNGRDALYFARHGLRVTAIDQSEAAITRLVDLDIACQFAPRFVRQSFAELSNHVELEAVYSRFTLHAVPKDEASLALAWAASALGPGGLLFVEARSVKGTMYGLGEPREPDAFVYQGHYRRFLRSEELFAELEELGFALAEYVESAGLSVYKDDDPVVIRVIARKR